MVYFTVIVILLFGFVHSGQSLQLLEIKRGIVLTPEEMFEFIDSITITPEEKKEMISQIKNEYKDFVFRDILKSEEMKKNGVIENVVDVDEFFDKCEHIKSSTLFDFILCLRQLSILTRDCHISFKILNSNKKWKILNEIILELPFGLSFNYDFSEVTVVKKNKFKDFEGIVEFLIGKQIIKIDGMDVVDYIEQLGKDYSCYSSSHSHFDSGLFMLDKIEFSNIKFPKEKIMKPISIEVKGIQTPFEIHYAMYISNDQKKQLKLNFNNNDNIKNLFYSQSSTTSLECEVDHISKLNTLILTNMVYDKSTLKQCIDKFGDYPLQIILSINKGGYFKNYIQLSRYIDKYGDINVQHDCLFSNHMIKFVGLESRPLDECTSFIWIGLNKFYKFLKNHRKINYGDVEHTTSLIIELFEKKRIESKYKKDPLEIVIYVDPFCSSTCAYFTKRMRENGAAIIVGFGGHPLKHGNSEFEIGSFPSAVKKAYIYSSCSNKRFKWSPSMRISFPFLESYGLYDEERKIPSQFHHEYVDIRIKFYGMYSHLYLNFFKINTLIIIQKIKIDCNPNNKYLVKRISECDNNWKSQDAHLHGGYKCGENGKWVEKCVPSYCDPGYKFNVKTNRCDEIKCEHENDNDFIKKEL